MTELEKYKRALELACEKIAEMYGECPYNNEDLPFPDYCDTECDKHQDCLCWDVWFLDQSERENEERQKKIDELIELVYKCPPNKDLREHCNKDCKECWMTHFSDSINTTIKGGD